MLWQCATHLYCGVAFVPIGEKIHPSERCCSALSESPKKRRAQQPKESSRLGWLYLGWHSKGRDLGTLQWRPEAHKPDAPASRRRPAKKRIRACSFLKDHHVYTSSCKVPVRGPRQADIALAAGSELPMSMSTFILVHCESECEAAPCTKALYSAGHKHVTNGDKNTADQFFKMTVQSCSRAEARL